MPPDILSRLRRCEQALGPWFSDDPPEYVLYDINNFTDENDDQNITQDHIRQYLAGRKPAWMQLTNSYRS
jgi:hypothetical protein